QYAPPHPFAINVPKVLAEVRQRSWHDRPWLALALVLLIPALTLALVPWDVLFARHVGPGAFYAVLPWSVLCAVAAAPLLWSLTALGLGVARFWRGSGGGRPSRRAVVAALSDMATLRNLKGGGIACDGGPARRWFHHALVAGFVLCFAATAIATLYHHALGWQAPYPVLSLPVVLGSMGGVGMMAGTVGLAWLKTRTDPALDAAPNDYTLLGLLLAVAATGLALLAWRDSAAMGMLLAVHLGCVVGFFATLAHGKFAHAPYRAAALLRAAMERQNGP
ncbi:MAG TPA: tricarballylate utilization 4Fe-4S protein TcuB, partial [Magnetospirillum sp.]|nr:tricarballylate utilization 4Fe-4S protein TcuB [Magnetospirillum sp.]